MRVVARPVFAPAFEPDRVGVGHDRSGRWSRSSVGFSFAQPTLRCACCRIGLAGSITPPRTLSHSRSARARAWESFGGEEAELPLARTRAPPGSGRVAIE